MAIASLASVFVGGALGGMARYLLSRLRWGTLIANTLACLLLGWAPSSLLLGAGIAGALSTWSTLAKELGTLITQRRWAQALGYFALTLALGLGAVLVGNRL